MPKRSRTNLPDLSYERRLWKKGYKLVGGVDEVGRGAFAGPVVAGCVVFQKGSVDSPVRVDDSKKLSPKRREEADIWIRKNCLAWGIGEASVSKINRLGIKKASEIAFRKAIVGCKIKIDYLLIDAFFVPYVRGLRKKNQMPIVRGDAKSLSIAAASIIAKVYRDKLMGSLKDEKYGWESNKGYGTKNHQQALKKYGASKLHRKLFIRKFVSSQAQ
jgi:ribonuclease HII